MKQEFYVFVQCAPTKTYEVGLTIAKAHHPIVKSISSVSGEWDLLLRIVIDGGLDVGKQLTDIIGSSQSIVRTNTIVAFPIYDPADVYFNED